MDINRRYLAVFCCLSLICVIMYASLSRRVGRTTFPVVREAAIIQPRYPPSRIRSFPTNLYRYTTSPNPINSSCGIVPSLADIKFNNIHWQVLQSGKTEFYLLGAYLDIRTRNEIQSGVIRILAMVNVVDLNVQTHCQLWFKNKVVLSKKTESYYMWKKRWGVGKYSLQPHLISCQVPKGHDNETLVAVSLVARPCDKATNHLKVVNNSASEKENFAVCVKGLTIEGDSSVRLVEWIELIRLLGASKIYFYELHVHEAVKKVLDFYDDKDMVTVTPLTLPGTMPNHPEFQHEYLRLYPLSKRLNELMPYNDCFFKHMYQYKFIVLLDIDEVIIPRRGSWVDLMETVTANNTKSSYDVRHVYFIDDFIEHHSWFQGVPQNMHMLQHVYRTKEFSKAGSYIKAFHNTDKVLTLHNHYPTSCVQACATYSISTHLAQLQHYREDCVIDEKSCNELKENVVMDTMIWKYKQPLIKRVQTALRILGFLK